MLRLSDGVDSVINSPGSVAVIRLDDEHFDFLVCNNYRHYVSRHIVQRRNGFQVIADLRLFEHGLKVPDSIAVSTDGGLVAVSNHYGKRIDVFRNDAGSAAQSPPVFSLGGIHYPHGVRFALNARLLFVADAGAPLVHVFAREGPSWKSANGPDASIQVVDDESFRRGQANPEEGGPKGVDVLADGRLFVVSCEEVPIAFFDFRSVRDQIVAPDTTDQRHSPSGAARLLETAIATMQGQRHELVLLRGERARQKAIRDRSLDQRLLRMIRRAALKALGSAGR